VGEYAEMMLDGTCCSSCGEFLECNFDLDVDEEGCVRDLSPGFPMMCASCQADQRAAETPPKPRKPRIRGAGRKRRPVKMNRMEGDNG
jgi:hypothetical protein